MAQACPGLATVTDCDLNVHNTAQIGNQCWMHENLRSAPVSRQIAPNMMNTMPIFYVLFPLLS